ncbi:MAG: hypothetical protein R3D56_02115 [Paracoccaceae bacterium]
MAAGSVAEGSAVEGSTGAASGVETVSAGAVASRPAGQNLRPSAPSVAMKLSAGISRSLVSSVS